MPGNLSVEQFLLLVTGILVGIAVLTVLAGILLLRRAPRQPFFLIRQQTAAAGWRLLVVAAGLFILAGTVRLFGGPVVFQVITPTPSITLTPSITFTPTITFTPSRTLRPTITPTPSNTYTLTPSPTPYVPNNIEQTFSSYVIPDPKMRVGPLTFARSFTDDKQPISPGVVFPNPVQKIVALYSYENVNYGVQWTVIWYRNGTLFTWESNPYYGPSAGIGVISWKTSPDYFPYGTYEVQIFAGREWKQSGTFDVTGNPPEPTSTVSPTITRLPSPTATRAIVRTKVPTSSPTP